MGRKKRGIVTAVLVLNFGILGFLEYYNFFAGSLNDLLGVFAMPFSAPTLKLMLPLGISFYTFQSMGYVIDVYREKVKAERNLGSALVTFKRFLVNQDISEGLKQIAELPMDKPDYLVVMASSLILLAASVIQERNDGKTIRLILDEKPFLLRLLVILVGIMMILIFGIYGPDFSAAEFVYMQF